MFLKLNPALKQNGKAKKKNSIPIVVFLTHCMGNEYDYDEPTIMLLQVLL